MIVCPQSNVQCLVSLSVDVVSVGQISVVEVESSVAVIDLGFNQMSAGGLDDADSLLCIQRGLDLKSGWDKTEVFTAVVKPELLAYLSNGS